MPLIMNGTTIPENVANAFSFNGTNVTNVVYNGTAVWNQSLFSGVWSGSSLLPYSTNLYNGIQTSGSTYRAMFVNTTTTQGYGPWLTANSNGLATGSSTLTVNISGTYTRGFTTTPTTFSLVNTVYMGTTVGTISFSKTSGFSGSTVSSVVTTYGFKTSSGLIRHQSTDTAGGAWISLT